LLPSISKDVKKPKNPTEAKMKSTKRAGRPTKQAEAGTKVSLGLKVTADTKSRLEEEASKSGRTQSQEAEFRIERSLDRLHLLPEVLELAYGTELAGLLISIAEAMNQAQLAGQITSLEDHPRWSDDAFSFDTVVVAAQAVFEALRPAGAIRNPPETTSAKLGQAMAKHVLDSLADDRALPFINNAKHARSLLGPGVVRRLKGKRP
jgi:TraY domain